MQQPSASTSTTTSRAVQLESFGGPEVLDPFRGTRTAGWPGADPGASHRGWNEPDDWFMTSTQRPPLDSA